MSTKKQFKQQQIWEETAEMLDTQTFTTNAKLKSTAQRQRIVSKAAIIHNLVMMKLREEAGVSND